MCRWIVVGDQVVDVRLAARIGRAEERRRFGVEEFRDVRRPDRHRVGAAQADVLDRGPGAVDVPGEGLADRRVIGIAARRAQAQVLKEGRVAEDRQQNFAEHFTDFELAARVEAAGRIEDQRLVGRDRADEGPGRTRRRARRQEAEHQRIEVGLRLLLAVFRAQVELHRAAGQVEEGARVAVQHAGDDQLLETGLSGGRRGDPRCRFRAHRIDAAEQVGRHAAAVGAGGEGKEAGRDHREGFRTGVQRGGVDVRTAGGLAGARIGDDVDRRKQAVIAHRVAAGRAVVGAAVVADQFVLEVRGELPVDPADDAVGLAQGRGDVRPEIGEVAAHQKPARRSGLAAQRDGNEGVGRRDEQRVVEGVVAVAAGRLVAGVLGIEPYPRRAREFVAAAQVAVDALRAGDQRSLVDALDRAVAAELVGGARDQAVLEHLRIAVGVGDVAAAPPEHDAANIAFVAVRRAVIVDVEPEAGKVSPVDQARVR